MSPRPLLISLLVTLAARYVTPATRSAWLTARHRGIMAVMTPFLAAAGPVELLFVAVVLIGALWAVSRLLRRR